MTNAQLYLAIGVPAALNVVALVMLYVLLNASMKAGFDAVNTRFDDMRDLWRSELRRVEEILDARLKHLEDRRP